MTAAEMVTTNDPAVYVLIVACVIIAVLAAAAIAVPAARREVQAEWDRQHDDWLDSIEPAPTCRASRDWVGGQCVSNDGHLYGLCPGCGKTNVSCTIIDPNLPYGPWVIDDHEPRIDPDLGLHGGDCWTNKHRTGDYGLCVCGRVEAGWF